MKQKFDYDVALSFAGEDREYVNEVASILKSKGVSVFYDRFEEANLWGKNLYDYLNDIYANKALYTIMFISSSYNDKLWTNHERISMQSRAFQEFREYILPARFDETEIPGIPLTIGYISLADKNPQEFCEIIFRKLILSGRSVPSEQIRNSLSPLIKIPKVTPSNLEVNIIDEKSNPIVGADIYLIADNNTFLNAKTNDEGFACIKINVRRRYRLFIADANHPAYILDEVDPNYNIQVSLHTSENIGSIICKSTGYIPGLKGRLNPILDTSNRTYLYADNIAIDGGKLQPTTFETNVPMDLEDCDGMIMQITVKAIQGAVSLIEFVKPIIDN
ncbi:toll/interleukin-1 receptor domain-containing protein [Porphyromonas somerae]|uniref:toll/interleukin-1 receptor domain-containing protein n=1 Tax=Porphyromonas somerae TaxID=322095 RepID=UPI001FCC67BF|nr:TIR domain-containing protein [Porphyromonas somerae]BDE82493.1 hypothetical protein CE91St14_15210 [Porphyromonas somerae]